MAFSPFVAYFRLPATAVDPVAALAAQRSAVMTWLARENGFLAAEFTERPRRAGGRFSELRLALAAAREAEATLVMPRSQGCARNVAAIGEMIAAGVELVALDNPAITRRALPMMAGLAEADRRATSASTRAAMTAAKAQGRPIGRQGAVLARVNKAAAYTRLTPLAGVFGGLIGEGLSVRAMAARLNEMQTPSPGGGAWHASNVHRALTRLAPERFGKGRA